MANTHGPRTDEERIVNGPFRFIKPVPFRFIKRQREGFLPHTVPSCKSGFVVSETHPFLGTSPDGCVHDPSGCDPFGLVEIKCPYSHQHDIPEMACSSKAFCSSLETTTDGAVVKLKTTHVYYSQVQGQMAITGRK